MLLVGSAFVILICAKNLYIALTESEPTQISVASLDAEYPGQSWLTITGELAVKYKAVEASTHRVHAGKGLSYIQVPIVPIGWVPATPI